MNVKQSFLRRWKMLVIVLMVSGVGVVAVGVAACIWFANAEESVFLDIEFVWIPPGEFLMGSPENESGRLVGEGPQHTVTIRHDFWLGKYEVTQEQWQSVMGNNPGDFQGDGRLPVNMVSWNDCQEFLQKMNGLGKGTFRLPTEAEWEYACRAGSTTAYCFGDDAGQLGDYAWYDGNSKDEIYPVGQKKPNAWGLHDMYGNAWEMCQDWRHDNYKDAPADGSAWESPADRFRVLRGGDVGRPLEGCRSAYRDYFPPDRSGRSIGFRVVRNP